MSKEIFNPLNNIKNLEEYKIKKWDKSLINKCILDLFINPRKVMYEWSNITEQTAHIKVGYVGQHLACITKYYRLSNSWTWRI